MRTGTSTTLTSSSGVQCPVNAVVPQRVVQHVDVDLQDMFVREPDKPVERNARIGVFGHFVELVCLTAAGRYDFHDDSDERGRERAPVIGGAVEQGSVRAADGCSWYLPQQDVEVTAGVQAGAGIALHVRVCSGVQHRRYPASRGLVRPAWLLTPDSLPIDEFHLAAEVLRQVPPDFEGDWFWLQVAGNRPVVNGRWLRRGRHRTSRSGAR
jgi:hypothetical protein